MVAALSYLPHQKKEVLSCKGIEDVWNVWAFKEKLYKWSSIWKRLWGKCYQRLPCFRRWWWSYLEDKCVLIVFLLYHAKGKIIASSFRTTHGHWLALMQGVWWNMSMVEELPESQHESCTIIFQPGFDVNKFLEWFNFKWNILFMFEYDCRYRQWKRKIKLLQSRWTLLGLIVKFQKKKLNKEGD